MSEAARATTGDGSEVSLVLGGGNALGAYHLGVCERLLEAGIEPHWYVGASIGAVTAAILVGNPPETRLERLRTYWQQAKQAGSPLLAAFPDEARARINNDYALGALLLGRPGLFRARFPGLWSVLPGMPPDLALRDHAPLARTLEQLIDFDRLNRATARVSIIALDLETGTEVWFDNRDGGIAPEHLLATTAFAPLFPPVEIGGRLLCDAGFGNNLPLDKVFRARVSPDLTCIGVDTYHLGHGRPESLDEVLARVQDISFAMQTHRTIAFLTRERELLRRLDPESPSTVLAYLAYRAPGHQRTLKPLDFSDRSIEERAAQGRVDMTAMLDKLATAPRDRPLAWLTLDSG
jgi:NTE family protein